MLAIAVGHSFRPRLRSRTIGISTGHSSGWSEDMLRNEPDLGNHVMFGTRALAVREDDLARRFLRFWQRAHRCECRRLRYSPRALSRARTSATSTQPKRALQRTPQRMTTARRLNDSKCGHPCAVLSVRTMAAAGLDAVVATSCVLSAGLTSSY